MGGYEKPVGLWIIVNASHSMGLARPAMEKTAILPVAGAYLWSQLPQSCKLYVQVDICYDCIASKTYLGICLLKPTAVPDLRSNDYGYN